MLSNVEYLNHLIYFISNSILVLLFRIYILVSLIKIKPLTCSHLLICRSHARHINKREQVIGLILLKLHFSVNLGNFIRFLQKSMSENYINNHCE